MTTASRPGAFKKFPISQCAWGIFDARAANSSRSRFVSQRDTTSKSSLCVRIGRCALTAAIPAPTIPMRMRVEFMCLAK